jgi:hypothetical protein
VPIGAWTIWGLAGGIFDLDSALQTLDKIWGASRGTQLTSMPVTG